MLMYLDTNYVILDDKINNLKHIYSNIAITNNPNDMSFDSITDTYNQKICIIHDTSPKNLKKEDRQIIEIKLLESNFEVVFFDKFVASTWDFKKIKQSIVNYGIPQVNNHIGKQKNKDIAIYNTKQHPTITRLAGDLRQTYNNVDEIIELPNSLDEHMINLSRYYLIINLEHSINNLLHPFCGTTTITNRKLPNNDLTIGSILEITEYDKIFKAIPQIIDMSDKYEQYEQDINTIYQLYNWQQFEQNFSNLMVKTF